MKILGTQPGRSELHLTQGDDAAIIVTNGGAPVPAPVTLWWPDGTITTGDPDEAGTSVGIGLQAVEVSRLVEALDGLTAPVAQLDVGTARTFLLDVVCHRTPRVEETTP